MLNIDDTIDRAAALPPQPDTRILRQRLAMDKRNRSLGTTALAALEKRLNPTERDRLVACGWEPPEEEGQDRAGVVWTDAEASSLIVSFSCGATLQQLCDLHKRARGGILSRLEKLLVLYKVNGVYFAKSTGEVWDAGLSWDEYPGPILPTRQINVSTNVSPVAGRAGR